ncbi:MAG: RuvX/YqgF family protein [Patescibacteria group bacterium]
MTVIAIDFGERWLGVAVGRDEPKVSMPLFTIDRNSEPDAVARLRAAAVNEGADAIVIGAPNPLRAEPGVAASAITQAVSVFAASLREAMPYTIEFMDERFTSNAAAVLRRDFPTADEHALAAMLIADNYLGHRA